MEKTRILNTLFVIGLIMLIVSCQIPVDTNTEDENNENVHPTTVLILDEAWTDDLTTGVNWFSIELNEDGKYLLEWLENFTGTVEMYEGDKTTSVPFIVASGRGDNFKVVDVTAGKYFIKIYSSYSRM